MRGCTVGLPFCIGNYLRSDATANHVSNINQITGICKFCNTYNCLGIYYKIMLVPFIRLIIQLVYLINMLITVKFLAFVLLKRRVQKRK